MQTKIEHTKKHIIGSNPKFCDILVTDAKLVLVECKKEEALLIECEEKLYIYKEARLTPPQWLNDVTWYKPILISETEKIEVGDWFYWSGTTPKIEKAEASYTTNRYISKILALPEHFSPQQLQMIVDGKLKDGQALLVECESFNPKLEITEPEIIFPDGTPYNGKMVLSIEHKIKLNPHITIYPVEEKMYTREEVKWKMRRCIEWATNKFTSTDSKFIEENI